MNCVGFVNTLNGVQRNGELAIDLRFPIVFLSAPFGRKSCWM